MQAIHDLKTPKISKQRSNSLCSETHTVILALRSPSPCRKLCFSPSLSRKIEYDKTISIDQIIEYKLRALKTSKCEQRQNSQNCGNEYNCNLFESIEAFLDEHQLFIVSPTPVKRFAYSKTCKNQNNEFENFEETVKHYSEGDSCSLEVKGLDLFHSKSNNPPIYEESMLLKKVSTSSLLQRRMRFKTEDSTTM